MANNDVVIRHGRSTPAVQSPHHVGSLHGRDSILQPGDSIETRQILAHDRAVPDANGSDVIHAAGDGDLLPDDANEHIQGQLVENASIYDVADKHDNIYSETEGGESNSRQGGGPDEDQDDSGPDIRNKQLVISPQEDELIDSPKGNGLAVVESRHIDENLQFIDDGNHGSPQPGEHSQLVFTSPILQSRAEIVPPTHELTVGQEFADVQSCRRALRDVAIALHFEIQTIKSDKTRFTAKCASDGCPWRIHAAKLPGVPTFSIRTIHKEHTCGGIAHLGHQQASVQWVANSVERRLRENPQCKPKEILEEIHRVHGITLSYKQAWRGKERIMATLRGSFEEDFRLLPQYCDQIKRTNPGSIAGVYVNQPDNSFHRLFISFQASIFGFLNACRPLIGLDRTVLKNKYLGTMLLATSFDGDGALFPLAFAVVDEENDDNWMWFLSELHCLLENNTENMPILTILSDRKKGITEAVEANFPTAFHGFCLRHLTESFQKEFNNPVLVNMLLEAANALTANEFESRLQQIDETSQEAGYWIRRVPPRLWATAHFEGKRFGQLTANVAESLNPWLLEASALPLIQMMECIRRQLMTWFNERREASIEWTSVLVPSAERRVSEAIEKARAFHVLRGSEADFQVISLEGNNTVDIRNRHCTCGAWQLQGLPCAHAVAALLSCRQNVHRFTESCFTIASYRKAYSQTIHPIPDRTLWKEMEGDTQTDDNSLHMIVNPPKSLRPPGQPRKRRARSDEQGRVKRVVHCSRCNQTGHFRTTCSAPI
ncbi:OLC1v1007101C1 [Oldenlandia corymbosa var. corymbosa]|uniref:OLC1v1007101C1 n=1 Tax=Oldenlandia corymbosa var. corymbosa TaxID=529605 RepID=A0AAV1DLK3_OLDCO|nr:OLC1v1007101C1 [Oldenlandia corymbosa var. corymbosa]